MGDSLPPPATFDLVGSYARRRGPDVEIVFADPKSEITGADAVVTLTRRSHKVQATGSFLEGPHGRRLVVTARREDLRNGTWTLALNANGVSERLDARLLVQGERPLVLLWGATGSPSVEPPPRLTAKRRAAAAVGRTLDRTLAVLPEERARTVRAKARRAARRILH